MNIAHGFSEIRLSEKKISHAEAFITQNLARGASLIDPYADKGSSQKEEVERSLQSIHDLEERIVDIKLAIARANASTSFTIDMVTRTVAEWIIWRQTSADRQLKLIQDVAATIRRLGNEHTASLRGLALGRDTKPDQMIFFLDEQWVRDQLDRHEEIYEKLDAELSVFNATTELEGV